MTSDEIRRTYLDFFAQRGHLVVPSASLVPPATDTSALFIVAGMHPLKPYFLGQEPPPAARLASCQKVFRTPDIDQVGSTTRHLTFFEMLGNFSFGDYFKQGAVELAWELSLDAFGFRAEDVWITVFEGDEALGLGPDQEAIDAWLAVGVPRERIVECPRSENFWQAGPSGPCGPCSELYLDRGVEHGRPDDLPGGDNERFLEYWNLVFMQYDLGERGGAPLLTPLPAQNIDTGLGLNRLACILQDTPSVFETDQFRPLIELGEELSGRRYGEEERTDRSLRILADHLRGTTFLLADGVVPSNEERGYVLRRIMRRAIQHGRALELEPGFMGRYAARVTELMGATYPELAEQRAAIDTWLSSEEDSFGRTLEQGTRLLEEVVERALADGAEGIAAADAFLLHDTYGFPIELTRELAAERDLGVDAEGFATLMDAQRARSRGSGPAHSSGAGEHPRDRARTFADGAGATTTFTGYETEEQATTVAAVEASNGRVLVKLAESPFYAAGGGQVSDGGWIECSAGDCRARVAEVFRLGEDQALAVELERGELEPGERVLARVDHGARRATECNHTATHLLHAALRERLGAHVHQAGSYVGPDKLRFDFSHGSALSREELSDVEDRVNEWILAGDRVSAVLTTLAEAKRLGAMALFGEKYGDVVRMVQIGDGHYSRELCGGTHVRSTAEIGLLRIVQETSSAANVRRIEALTGPAAVQRLRHHDDLLQEAASRLRTVPQDVPAVIDARERERHELQRALAEGPRGDGALDLDALIAGAEELHGATVLTAAVPAADAKALLAIADRVKGALPDAAIVLGAAADGRVHLIAAVAPALVARGVKAGAVVKAAATVAGGGGGGRDTLAQAGGRDPGKLDEAIAAGRAAIAASLA